MRSGGLVDGVDFAIMDPEFPFHAGEPFGGTLCIGSNAKGER